MNYLFVGERQSPTAKRRGWTWRHGRLAAKQLFDALRECGVDPLRQRYTNVLDYGTGLPAPHALRRVGRSPLVVVAMGRRVERVLASHGVPHVAIPHPAARGKVRAKAVYAEAVRAALGLPRPGSV